ncbi:hypothetical protein AVEN_51724-1 [Araneus ventricosus]|uniref:Uncharacterized protein n=1 Tax=Araneus ventricosus TaxID=182803 RepID=A0A4Y2GEP3_ARAVE|nr:hypothetical protein AVEN_51724-1 [Araneus ventricosus]
MFENLLQPYLRDSLLSPQMILPTVSHILRGIFELTSVNIDILLARTTPKLSPWEFSIFLSHVCSRTTSRLSHCPPLNTADDSGARKPDYPTSWIIH